MSPQEGDGKLFSLEQLSTLDLIKTLSSRLEQGDTRQRILPLEDLDGLIKAAETMVQAMRRERNARVAINHLPAEVLEEIFVTTCTVKLAEYRFKHYGCGEAMTIWNPTWIEKGRAVGLMLVCHPWKEIASGIRELWNGVETYWEHKDRILLERSGQGPLKVLTHGKMEPPYAVVHALQNVEHSSRIQELYLTSPLLARENREYFGMLAPSLRSLALQGDYSRVPNETLNLFDNHIPCLERLSLSYVGWLPSNAFAELTFLAIDQCYVSKCRAKIRSVLAGTPNLVDLVLRKVADQHFGYIRVETEAADMKPVSLTRLRRLLIENMWTDDVDYVFRDARLDGDISVSIKRVRPRDDGHRILKVVSTWSLNALKHPKELHFQPHVAIIAGASSGFRFEVERSVSLRYWFSWSRNLPLSSISHLCTFEDASMPTSLERVHNFLRQMTSLETLSVNIEGLTKIIDALTLFLDPTDPPLCPALTTLRITIRQDSDCNTILDSLLPQDAQLGVKHLYVGLIGPPNEFGEALQAAKDHLHGNFESVKSETLLYDKAYNITLPLVCDKEVHALWPRWL
ncbi:uncharacterized protein LAESUDRAFT_815669 [Laetiporus sulphureus 93-53]|uniref:F-box domain-containing protein n=1 Tax=Laetiporus sulphureus 93-53 TaxID=1314785 RepID=A0A165BZ94_9APHY|nr:uncharacterized protein LAESUDRAFT_815669 [Laetiporus sulphureus 93-53]KZT01920.1 hypothetical protein LAESUDRAFT_815669 [Laetiporus sulphureus 93-53]